MLDPAHLPWRTTRYPGVEVAFVPLDDGSQDAIVWIRLRPGARYPRHRHRGAEDVLVLEGVFEDENGRYSAGRFVRFPPGSGHAPSCPADAPGCLLFAIARGGVDLVTGE